jgi:hypothetical protein
MCIACDEIIAALVAAIDSHQRAVEALRDCLARGSDNQAELSAVVEAEWLKSQAAHEAYFAHLMKHVLAG